MPVGLYKMTMLLPTISPFPEPLSANPTEVPFFLTLQALTQLKQNRDFSSIAPGEWGDWLEPNKHKY